MASTILKTLLLFSISSIDRDSKKKHYSKVLMQQGRVSVDADWNEQQAINQHRIETEALDVLGECGTSVNNDGFKITAKGSTLNIGKGRYYVDGICTRTIATTLRMIHNLTYQTPILTRHLEMQLGGLFTLRRGTELSLR